MNVPADRVVVRTLVSLKLRLLANGLRRSPGRRALYLVGSAVGLLFTALIATGFAFLNGHAGAADASVMLTTSLAIGWAALPLFLFSSDESSDPTRLTMLPLRPGPLLRGTLLAALIGPGPVIALVLLTGAVIAAAAGAVAVPFAVLGVPLTVVCLVTLSRAVAAGNAKLLSSRRGKDFAIFGGLLFAILVQVGNLASQSILGRSGEGGLDLSPLKPFASVLRWIPPVSALDSARTAGDSVPLALLQLAATGALLALLLRWWQRSLQDLMVTADSSTLIATQSVGRASRNLFPDGRVGAVMQRHLRYAWREPRAKAAVFTSIGMTLVMCVLSVVQGWGSVYMVAMAGLMLGLQMVNLFGMDGSAFWMVSSTLATPADARDELRGRAYAVLSYAVPISTLLGLVLAAATGQWAELPPALGLSYAALGGGVGLGALLSVLAPYAMPADSNPMRNAAPGQGGVVLLNTFGSMLGVLVITGPVALLLFALPGWALLPIGIGFGALLAVGGTRLAAGRLLERLPEILATAIER
ncbi:ABC-2 type transport system permease protein [Kitasatospora gansuensis]|uniref:ABC-2 type transport system permease protein n=1 Tax=Kitasatospora gansuensis TaxID=258050 RepID=A0A7W7SE03_9ACTN|nr:transporter [Kitasatospora gansuensis]MBB4948693.1 ABC-2 type transport system permease protein [Kitasatospora gansuensis]